MLQPRKLSYSIITYLAKGVITLREEDKDSYFYTGNIDNNRLEDIDIIGLGLICTATERIRLGIVEILNTHL